MKNFLLVLSSFLVWIISCLLVAIWTGGAYWDTTISRVYTLDQASMALAENLSQKINFKLYVSDNLSSYSRESYDYAEYVIAILQQYQKHNPSNIEIEIIRTNEYTPEAKVATQAGIKELPHNNGYAYFGLTATSGDKKEVIPQLLSARQAYFENDINRIIDRLITAEKTKIGIFSPIVPLKGIIDKGGFSLLHELGKDYNLHSLSEKLVYIPTDLKLVLVFLPNQLPPHFIYALDQYLLRGGKLVFLLDPHSEMAGRYLGYPPQNRTNIVKLLANWGIVYNPNHIIGSFEGAIRVAGGFDYPLWFFTSGLGYNQLHFRSSGSLEINPREDVEYEVLVKSPVNSGTINVSSVRYAPKKEITERFKADEQSHILALKAKGHFVSGFNGGYFDDTNHYDDTPPFVFRSNESSELAVIADSDFVGDDAWATAVDEKNPIYGAQPYAENAEFLLKIIRQMLDEKAIIPAIKASQINSIATEIAKPLQNSIEQQIYALNSEIVRNRNAIAELNDKMLASQDGSRLQYRSQISKLENQNRQNNDEISQLNHKVNYAIQEKINFLMLLNVIIWPLLLLIILALGCRFARIIRLRE